MSKVKNGDMPAMPITDQDGLPFDNLPIDICTIGLTKRETFAMHMMQNLMMRDGYHNYEDMANDAIQAADALLSELERTSNGVS